jgi:very-short-patch-repair endonuclease
MPFELADVLQRGAFTRADLVAAGMSRRTISRHLAKGMFVRLGPGVLCVAGREKDPLVVDLAVHLRTGYALTGPSAAAHFPPGPVMELTMRTKPWVLGRHVDGIDGEFVKHPKPEIVGRQGVVVASPRQAALDCIRVLPTTKAEDLGFRCVQQGLLSVAYLDSQVTLLKGYRNVERLRSLADGARSNAHSRSENLFHQLLKISKVEGWVGNLSVRFDGESFRIDIAFPELKIAIEYDSPFTHSAPSRFRSDRRKWNILKRHGWVVLNYTWEQISTDWANTLAEILTFIEMRRTERA